MSITVKELIEKLSSYPMDAQVLHVSKDRTVRELYVYKITDGNAVMLSCEEPQPYAYARESDGGGLQTGIRIPKSYELEGHDTEFRLSWSRGLESVKNTYNRA